MSTAHTNRSARALLLGALSFLLACSSSSTSDKAPVVLQLIAVTPAAPSLAQGAQQQLTATGKYSDGSARDLTSSVTWASLDPVVAVSGGLVRASTLGGGKAVVTATLGQQVGFTEVSVTGSQLAVLHAIPAMNLPVGISVPLVVTGEYVDGSERDLTSAADWQTTDPGTAIVAGGLVTGVAEGNATVTAAVGELAVSTAITVTPAVLQSISVAPSNSPVLATTRVEAFSAFGLFDDGSMYDLTEMVAWDSSDPDIATISNTSGTRGQATALLAGSADVTASLDGVTGTQTLFVEDDATQYVESRVPFAWTDMSDGARVVGGDDFQSALPDVSGFTFEFFGASYATTDIHVSTNGLITFGSGSTSYSSTTIPYVGAPDGFVAAGWDDLVTSVYFKAVGTAPARQLVIEWDGITFSGALPIKMQAALSEGTNTIDLRYASTVGAHAVIGVEDLTGTIGTQHSANAWATGPRFAIRFSP
jgi:uncharacterized protein YjdB